MPVGFSVSSCQKVSMIFLVTGIDLKSQAFLLLDPYFLNMLNKEWMPNQKTPKTATSMWLSTVDSKRLQPSGLKVVSGPSMCLDKALWRCHSGPVGQRSKLSALGVGRMLSSFTWLHLCYQNMSSVQNPCWLVIVGDYTTQYLGDYSNPTGIMEW